jgi:hypothetical protein
MAKRRSRGDGGIHWDEKRQRWIASVTVGYTPAGKRIVKKGSGNTKTAAKNKLKEILRDHDDGLAAKASADYTVANAVNDWLANCASAIRTPSRLSGHWPTITSFRLWGRGSS